MIDNFNSKVNPEKEEYKTITPFKMYIKGYFPFIEDTMEAVDNYGLLCKVVDYLNNIISNENIQIDNINALYQAFTNFKDEVVSYINTQVLPELNEKIEYIDNYFDNLDVQNEINNKLDEYVQNGTLYTIMEPYLETITQDIQSYNTRIRILENRMDSFSSLKKGSTTGDAELTDIRNGYSGLVYPTARRCSKRRR